MTAKGGGSASGEAARAIRLPMNGAGVGAGGPEGECLPGARPARYF